MIRREKAVIYQPAGEDHADRRLPRRDAGDDRISPSCSRTCGRAGPNRTMSPKPALTGRRPAHRLDRAPAYRTRRARTRRWGGRSSSRRSPCSRSAWRVGAATRGAAGLVDAGDDRRPLANAAIEWPRSIAALILVILFIPIRRYTLPVNLPFQLEPYRLPRRAARRRLGFASLLVDPRTRLRRRVSRAAHPDRRRLAGVDRRESEPRGGSSRPRSTRR